MDLRPIFPIDPRLALPSSLLMPTPQQQTLHLIRTYYDTFNTGDRVAFLSLLTQDVAHEINQGACELGQEAFRQFLVRMDRCYRERVCDLVPMASEDGTRGAAEFFIEGQYLATDDGLPPATGQRYRLRVGAFFEVKDGLISRISNHYNLADWLRQVAAA